MAARSNRPRTTGVPRWLRRQRNGAGAPSTSIGTACPSCTAAPGVPAVRVRAAGETAPARHPREGCRAGGRSIRRSVRGLVGLDHAGRDATTVADGVTVLAGPVADGAGLLAVHAAAGAATAAAATGGTATAADLAGGRD